MLHATQYMCFRPSSSSELKRSQRGTNYLKTYARVTVQNFMNQTANWETTVQSDIHEFARLLRIRMLSFILRIDRFWTHSYPEVPSPHSHT